MSASDIPTCRRARRRPGRSRNGRQEHLERGALAYLAGYFDPTLVLLDDAINRCQSQPRAFANLLRGEERLENAGQHLRGDPDAGVADQHTDIVTRARLGIAPALALRPA